MIVEKTPSVKEIKDINVKSFPKKDLNIKVSSVTEPLYLPLHVCESKQAVSVEDVKNIKVSLVVDFLIFLVNDYDIKVSSVTEFIYPPLHGCENKLAGSVEEVKSIKVIDCLKFAYFCLIFDMYSGLQCAWSTLSSFYCQRRSSS